MKNAGQIVTKMVETYKQKDQMAQESYVQAITLNSKHRIHTKL